MKLALLILLWSISPRAIGSITPVCPVSIDQVASGAILVVDPFGRGERAQLSHPGPVDGEPETETEMIIEEDESDDVEDYSLDFETPAGAVVQRSMRHLFELGDRAHLPILLSVSLPLRC